MRPLVGEGRSEEDWLYHLAWEAMQTKSTVRCINTLEGNENSP